VASLRLKQLLDIPAAAPLQIAAPLDASVTEPPPAFAGRLPVVVEPAVKAEVVGIDDRTAVREAAALVRLREATLRLTEAERRPSVAVTSNYSQVAYPSDLFPTGDFRTNWTVGASLQFPVLTGGRQRGSEIAARADVQAARLQLQQIQELAQLDVESALAELTAARAAFEASAGTIEQAQRAYAIADVRFRAGVSTQLELTDARLLLQQAEANRAQAARDLQVARARVALLPDLPLGSASATAAAPSSPASAAPAGAGGSAGGARTNLQGGGGRE
jgi:outer membrane protein